MFPYVPEMLLTVTLLTVTLPNVPEMFPNVPEMFSNHPWTVPSITQVSTVRKQVTDGSLPVKLVDALLFL